ncbi:MAG: hypothetical protein H7338_19000 [Candidatus Sericytochromatia bacterium]|nr:hypothetical protein [Candidatus Sericytochromatia bacterium]
MADPYQEGKANAFQFSQQLRKVPPKRPVDDDTDYGDTMIRKPGPAAIGAMPATPAAAGASKFANQVRTTIKRTAEQAIAEDVPRCLRLLPPDLLERWRVQKPKQLATVQRHLDAGELHEAYGALRELLYDAPRLAPLIDDIFLVEAYSQLPADARAALPATALKAVLPAEALPAFADVVGNIRKGNGNGCVSALQQLGDFSPAAERLVAHKLKGVLPKPTRQGAPSEAPEIRPTRATVQAAFTPPPPGAYTPPPAEVAEETALVPDEAMAWLYALGLGSLWETYAQRCESRQWDIAWDAAEAVASGLGEIDPEHEQLPVLGEAMAMQVAEGILAELVPELASRLSPPDLFPVMAGGGTALLLGCNDALSMGDWPDACERLAMLPDDAQIGALAAAIIATAWGTMAPAAIQQAIVADVVACWIEGGANALMQFLRNLRLGERRGAEEALRALAGLGASNTKIALLRAKLGWQVATGIGPQRPTLRPR